MEVQREPAGNDYKSMRSYTLEEAGSPLFEADWTTPVAELFGSAER